MMPDSSYPGILINNLTRGRATWFLRRIEVMYRMYCIPVLQEQKPVMYRMYGLKIVPYIFDTSAIHGGRIPVLHRYMDVA